MDEVVREAILQTLIEIKQSLNGISERLDHHDRQIATMMQWWTEPIVVPQPAIVKLPPGADVP